MTSNVNNFSKNMKIIYICVFVLALFVIADGQKKVLLLENNPVVSQFNKEMSNYKIVKAIDSTTNIESQNGLTSKEYTVRVTKEETKENYVKIGQKIIDYTKSNYGSIGKININFISKKDNILLHNVVYSPKK